MKKIYLASDSKARKQILKMFGLRFTVLPSRVQEINTAGHMSFAKLVKINALRKARACAQSRREGVVIAADTISVQDGKIFGKPKNIAHARTMLKKLSRNPQWLYTGIALIDTQTKKTLLDYEKTKVYMDPLSDSDINAYFKAVSPLDKAGSFDIQGRGAFFIRRIEGCFYNVVGLPVRKLYRMFKEAGVLSALICVCAAFLSGCATEYNIASGEQETYFYSTDSEVKMGQAMEKQVEKEYKLAEDPLLGERVQAIGRKIVAVCDRKDIDYTFKVLQEDEVNAVSLPGGIVYINKGLIDKVTNDGELAGVIAHEVGHIVARHSIKKLQALQGYSLLRILVAAVPSGSGEVGQAADVAFVELLLGYAREDELLADQLSVRYLKRAGYDPHSMIIFLEKLDRVNKRQPLRPRSYLKTHPYVPDRIRVVKQELGEDIDFNDYINIEQMPHK